MTRKQERSVARYAGALQRRVMEVRAEDLARGQIASGRIQDIRKLSKDALQAAGEIGDCLAYEASARPYFARELQDIAATGARGLNAELACFIADGH